MADDSSPLLTADAALHRASAAAEPQAHQVPALALNGSSNNHQQHQQQQRGERVEEKVLLAGSRTELRAGPPPTGDSGRETAEEVEEGRERARRDKAGVTRSAHGGKGGEDRRRGREKRINGTHSVGDWPSRTECENLPTQVKEKSSES